MSEAPILMTPQMSMPILPNLRMGSMNSMDWNYDYNDINVDPRNLGYESMDCSSMGLLHDNSILSKLDDFESFDQDIDLY